MNFDIIIPIATAIISFSLGISYKTFTHRFRCYSKFKRIAAGRDWIQLQVELSNLTTELILVESMQLELHHPDYGIVSFKNSIDINCGEGAEFSKHGDIPPNSTRLVAAIFKQNDMVYDGLSEGQTPRRLYDCSNSHCHRILCRYKGKSRTSRWETVEHECMDRITSEQIELTELIAQKIEGKA